MNCPKCNKEAKSRVTKNLNYEVTEFRCCDIVWSRRYDRLSKA